MKRIQTISGVDTASGKNTSNWTYESGGDMTDLTPIKQIPILEVARRLGLQVRGKKAMCFGGHDTKPSLCFVPGKNIWKCFGCERRGDAIALVKDVLGCDFKAALDWFAVEFGVDVRGAHHNKAWRGRGSTARRKRSTQKAEQAVCTEKDDEFCADPEVYGWLIEKCGEVSDSIGLEYLGSHGIPLTVANRFGICELRRPTLALRRLIDEWSALRVLRCGLAWGDSRPERLIWGSYAVLFPFRENGQIVYIQGRLLRGKTKFIGLRGVPKPLYNAECLASLKPGTTVHLCEGIPDALAIEAQQLHAVAVLGASSFRTEWVDSFLNFDVVVVPDGDSGGETFVRVVSRAFRKRGKAVRAVEMPEGQDAADLLRNVGGNP